jgi:hypothetical protein
MLAGTSIFSVFMVLRLSTKLNFVGWMTGDLEVFPLQDAAHIHATQAILLGKVRSEHGTRP